ncbi:MAG: ABC transporter substrate-binding protein [Egibacteraceae bacterium]
MDRGLRLPLALASLVALLTASCTGGGDGQAEQADQVVTLVFGTGADPVSLDGVLVSDGESLRAVTQMFEGLVGLKPGSTELAPALAESWEPEDDARSWTFDLRQGVTFHDGTPFNAQAVCFNFDRWHNFTGSFQRPDATYYWQTVFNGFADGGGLGPSLYEGCEAIDEQTVRIDLTQPSASFLPALALPSFTIASPTALDLYDADQGEVGEGGIFRPTSLYGTAHPTGTGPFRFREWRVGDRLVMERNPDYWGEAPGNIQTLIFRPIGDNAARLQALQTGEIQGYDLVAPEDYATIRGDAQLQLLARPPFNVAYLGINQGMPPLEDIRVRQAIAHAINRQAIIDGFYVGQGEVAHEFMPPSLFGYADDVATYDYNPDRARQLLDEAGYTADPVEITFAFPSSDGARPYMPDPRANYEAMKADLEAVGFRLRTDSAPWRPDYLGKVHTGQYGLYLLGWTGEIGDPDNFIGTFFQAPQQQWGFFNPEIFALLNDAERETDPTRRTELYQQANRLIMDFLPGLPYAHSKPALALQANIHGYIPSPATLEPFALVTVT